MTTEATPIKPWHVVRRSKLHGNGVFAARKIPAGTRIIEYGGARISAKEADRRHPTNPDDPFHTFFFALSSGRVIDGGDQGNDARWINHSCQPNCEAQEGKHGKRVYIVALQDIPRGTELSYDYGLVLDGRITKALKEGYRCLCGTPPCRGTMLALPKKKKTDKKASKEAAEAVTEKAEKVAEPQTKAAPKKAAPKKAAPKEAATKNAATKKAAPSKAAPSKAAPKNAATKRAATQRAATKKAPTQAAPADKSVP